MIPSLLDTPTHDTRNRTRADEEDAAISRGRSQPNGIKQRGVTSPSVSS
jgi:hypothetical protein